MSRLSRLLVLATAWTNSDVTTNGEINRFAATAPTKRAFPEIGSTIDHLREVLGDEADPPNRDAAVCGLTVGD